MKTTYPEPVAVQAPDAPAPGGFNSQAVKAGDFVFVAGQLPHAEPGQELGPDAVEQLGIALEPARDFLMCMRPGGGPGCGRACEGRPRS